jgi:hypothetical protein
MRTLFTKPRRGENGIKGFRREGPRVCKRDVLRFKIHIQKLLKRQGDYDAAMAGHRSIVIERRDGADH